MSLEAAEAVRQLAVRRLERASNHVLATFAAVPDDRLDFSPSETARSCRSLLAHIIEGNGYVAQAMGLSVPTGDEKADRDVLARVFQEGATVLLEAVRAMPAERIGATIPFFGQDFPTPAFLMTAEWHMSRHAGQIDYLQTVWGDLEDHA